jgi:unsaturated rhamnogalacturonyl hydrolase
VRFASAFSAAASAASVLAISMACSCSSDGTPDPPSGTSGACTPAPPADDAAYASAHAPSSADVALARAVADRYIAEHPPESLAYDWGESVLMTALTDLARVTGAATYREYVARWLTHHITQGYSIVGSDRCAPATAAAMLTRTSCEAPYVEVVQATLSYLEKEALRTSDGGISHFGASPLFGATLWIDSLFMFGEIFVRWGEGSGGPPVLAEYAKQYVVFAQHLQDANGLFRHAHAFPGPQDADVHWARGNGWVLVSSADYLRVKKARGESDDAIAASFVKLAGGVVATQDKPTGLWWTVLERPGDTYLETSATALFATGLARGYRLKLLDASVRTVIDAAMKGVRSKLVNDDRGRPVVTDISGPTDVGRFEDYKRVKLENDLTFGVGSVIMALVEVSGMD